MHRSDHAWVLCCGGSIGKIKIYSINNHIDNNNSYVYPLHPIVLLIALRPRTCGITTGTYKFYSSMHDIHESGSYRKKC